MSNDNEGDAVDLVGIEMDYLEKEEDVYAAGLDCKSMGRKTKKAVASSYEERFESVLVDGYSKEAWWDAVNSQLKEDADLAEKVSRRSA